MWEVLDARAVVLASSEASDVTAQQAASGEAPQRAVNARTLRGNARREAMFRSTRLSDLNIFSFSGCSDADDSRLRLEEDAEDYVRNNID
eukprot:6026577-Pleurochrysis_carterae.AAC.1